MVKSIIIGFAIYMFTQAVSLVLILGFGLVNPNVMNLINTTDVINVDTIKSVMYAVI